MIRKADILGEQLVADSDEDDPERLREQGSEELIMWIRHGANEQIGPLLDAHADPSYQDKEGMTALHHAAALGARVSIRALLKSNRCDFLARDNHGRTASELAFVYARDYALARLLNKKRLEQARRTGAAL